MFSYGCNPKNNQVVRLFIFCCVLISIQQLRAISITNTVTVDVDKDYYPAFQVISCRISGLSNLSNSVVTFKDREGYVQNRIVRIVTASQLVGDGTIDELTNYAKVLFYSKNYTSDEVYVKIKLWYETIIGPPVWQRWNYDRVGYKTDNGYTNVSPANNSWTAGPYRCILVNDDNTEVLGTSQPFTIGTSNPVTIHVNKDVYIPGETMQANVFSMNQISYDDWDDGDYVRVYKVPYDLSSNPILLNTDASYVGTLGFKYSSDGRSINRSLIEQTVYWKTPGMYQIVLFSDYLQLVRGMSNVFEVAAITRSKNTTVTNLNTTGIYPGQHVSVTIYAPESPPYNALITVAFIRARDTTTEYVNGTKRWIAPHQTGSWKWNNAASAFYLDYYDALTWDSGTTNLTVTVRYTSLLSGWFKVVIQAGGVVIGVSKQLLVKYPNIQIPLPKRTYSQWESIPIKDNINNPYFRDVIDYTYYYQYQIVPQNFTKPLFARYFTDHPDEFGFRIDPSTVVSFAPGIYNIRCFVYYAQSYRSHTSYILDNVVLIRNTTFRVVQNDAYLVIADKMRTFEYNDIISYSFTTGNKVPIYGGFGMSSTTNSYQVLMIEQSNSSTDLAVINGTVQIDWFDFGCFNNQSQFQLYVFIGNLSANSGDLSIDQSTQPEECQNYSDYFGRK